jgi:hypothetical protein
MFNDVTCIPLTDASSITSSSESDDIVTVLDVLVLTVRSPIRLFCPDGVDI